MSITPVSPSRPVDNSVQHPVQSIELASFSSGPGGAWDDRELINAANSAMKEFHVCLCHQLVNREIESLR